METAKIDTDVFIRRCITNAKNAAYKEDTTNEEEPSLTSETYTNEALSNSANEYLISSMDEMDYDKISYTSHNQSQENDDTRDFTLEYMAVLPPRKSHPSQIHLIHQLMEKTYLKHSCSLRVFQLQITIWDATSILHQLYA